MRVVVDEGLRFPCTLGMSGDAVAGGDGPDVTALMLFAPVRTGFLGINPNDGLNRHLVEQDEHATVWSLLFAGDGLFRSRSQSAGEACNVATETTGNVERDCPAACVPIVGGTQRIILIEGLVLVAEPLKC